MRALRAPVSFFGLCLSGGGSEPFVTVIPLASIVLCLKFKWSNLFRKFALVFERGRVTIISGLVSRFVADVLSSRRFLFLSGGVIRGSEGYVSGVRASCRQLEGAVTCVHLA